MFSDEMLTESLVESFSPSSGVESLISDEERRAYKRSGVAIKPLKSQSGNRRMLQIRTNKPGRTTSWLVESGTPLEKKLEAQARAQGRAIERARVTNGHKSTIEVKGTKVHSEPWPGNPETTRARIHRGILPSKPSGDGGQVMRGSKVVGVGRQVEVVPKVSPTSGGLGKAASRIIGKAAKAAATVGESPLFKLVVPATEACRYCKPTRSGTAGPRELSSRRSSRRGSVG